MFFLFCLLDIHVSFLSAAKSTVPSEGDSSFLVFDIYHFIIVYHLFMG